MKIFLGPYELTLGCLFVVVAVIPLVYARHLQRTYSARETGVTQQLVKHNLTRITNAPAAFLIQF